MDTETQLNAWLVAARAVHFGACLLLFGTAAFDRWVAAPAMRDEALCAATRWDRTRGRIIGWSLTFALISGVGWFALNAITMSGLAAREALQPDVLRIVLTETHFGRLWAIRGALWVVTLIAIVVAQVRTRSRAALLLASGALSASLAWAGHGTEGNVPGVHLAADALHILIGGLWPAGLLPFGLLLAQVRHTEGSGKWQAIARVTRRFSAVSLLSVAALAATGVINSLFLIGAWSDLFVTPYGKMLAAKVLVFLVMVALGALNLLRWKPRLSVAGSDRAAHAVSRLRLNVTLELVLGAIVFVLVGVLGILPPAIDAIAHAHHHHHG